MTRMEQERRLPVGSADWYKNVDLHPTQTQLLIAEHMHRGSGLVFRDSALADFVADHLQVMSTKIGVRQPIDRVAALGASQIGAIARSVGVGMHWPLYQAMSARWYLGSLENYHATHKDVQPITITKKDLSTGKIIDSTTTNPAEDRQQVSNNIGTMQRTLGEFEATRLSAEEREQAELLGFVFHLPSGTRNDVLTAIRKNDNWKPLERQVILLKRQRERLRR